MPKECICVECVGQEEHDRQMVIAADMNRKYLTIKENETQEEAQWRLHAYLTDSRRRVKVDCYCMFCKGEKEAGRIAIKNMLNALATKQ